MKVIWKYPFKPSEMALTGPARHHAFAMPVDAEILSLGIQNNIICLWALGETDAQKVHRNFCVVGTGRSDDFENLKYIGTVQMSPFVWHVFEEI